MVPGGSARPQPSPQALTVPSSPAYGQALNTRSLGVQAGRQPMDSLPRTPHGGHVTGQPVPADAPPSRLLSGRPDGLGRAWTRASAGLVPYPGRGSHRATRSPLRPAWASALHRRAPRLPWDPWFLDSTLMPWTVLRPTERQSHGRHASLPCDRGPDVLPTSQSRCDFQRRGKQLRAQTWWKHGPGAPPLPPFHWSWF